MAIETTTETKPQDSKPAEPSWLDQMEADDRKVLAENRKSQPAASTAPKAKEVEPKQHIEDASTPAESVTKVEPEPEHDEPGQEPGEANTGDDDDVRMEREITRNVLQRLPIKGKAREALLASIDGMTVEEMREAVSDAKAQQKAGDGMGSKLKAAEEKLAALEAERAKSKPESESVDPIIALKTHFSDLGDDTAADLVGRAFTGLSEKIAQQAETIKALQQSAPVVAGKDLLSGFKAPLDRVNREFDGAFDTDEKRVALLDRAEALMQNPAYIESLGGVKPPVEDVLRAAARLMNGSDIRHAQRQVLANVSRERKGQLNPSTGSQRGKTAPLDEDAKEKLIIQGLKDGQTPEQLNAKFYSKR